MTKQKKIPNIQKYFDERLSKFIEEHQDVFDEIDNLTYWRLREDLKEAIQYNKGYYKNKRGEYLYIKGIEVTNDTGNLLRMGYNGEDRGVWIHYSEISNKTAHYCDVPVSAFTLSYFKTSDLNKRMEPTTKEDFDTAVQRVVQNIISDYPEKRPAEEYNAILDEWEDLCDRVDADYPDYDMLPEDSED